MGHIRAEADFTNEGNPSSSLFSVNFLNIIGHK